MTSQVYNRAAHGELHPEGEPWVFECDDYEDQFFATEEEACAAQREWRQAHGFDPITGASKA